MGHMKVFYSDAFVAAGEDFDTTRKAAWVAESLRARPVPGTYLVEPAPLDAEQLETVHAPDYVRAVRTGEPRSLAESNGLGWDAGLWTAVCASNGASSRRRSTRSGPARTPERSRPACTTHAAPAAAGSARSTGSRSRCTP